MGKAAISGSINIFELLRNHNAASSEENLCGNNQSQLP